MTYFLYFAGAALAAMLFTPMVRRLAIAWGCMDIPRPPRNLHDKPTPKLGGVAVFLSFVLLASLYGASGGLDFNIVPLHFITAIIGGGIILIIGGVLDDRFDLPAWIQWIFPALAALIVVNSGIGVGITSLTNPFGQNPIDLSFQVFNIPASVIFVFVWLLGMMFTTKFLDGLDGLTSGVSLIAGLTMFFLSLNPDVQQPITATLSLIFCGALAGYLAYSFPPASIFLGEGGSTFTGFILGVLSVILGAKIATALLVMGVPILDVAFVLGTRLWSRKSPFKGDRLHLHFRLLDLGFTQRQTLLILYGLSALFGFTAIFLQSTGKVVALVILLAVMVALAISVVTVYKRRQLKG